MWKVIWPELVGREGDEAKSVIEKENPVVTVMIVDEDLIVPHDLCCNRVWVWVNKSGHVIRPPRVG
ncbi:hypothetical protein Dimus_008801 [Dionaea muscipula]